MSERSDTMKEIITRLRKFRDERNWKQFHTPENIANGVIIEAAELLENYQWMGFKQPNEENIKEEIADISIYLLMLSDYYGFDFEQIIHEKITKNEEKYPVDKAYGKADKYHKL